MAETPSKAGARGAAAPAHGEARARLLAAASRLFAQHGFEGVSVRDIAAEAGVGHAGVNYHFRSKSELYKEVLRKHGPGAAMARAGVAPHSPAGEGPSGEPRSADEARRALIRWVHAFVTEGALPDDPIVDGLVRHELRRAGGPRDEVFEGVIRPKHREVMRLIAEVRPELDPVDLSVAAIGVLSQGVYYRIARPVALRLLGVDELTDELAERIVSRVLANTLGGLALPPLGPDEPAARSSDAGDSA